MNKKLITVAIMAMAAVTSGYVLYRRAHNASAPAYRTAAVQRGNIESTVAATGTLGAVTTVQVGTQVSGQISAIYVDFNSKVKKGQLIARIDPTLQQQAVEDAQAGVSRAQATLTQTKLEYDRNKILHDQKIVTDPEFNTAQLNYQLARANATSAQIALDKARQNLSYTSIYAPIDGIVVERDMDVGQTVAASLSAPQLFVIAKDLSQMQILATVDESDIGQIKDDQTVSFTVQAYPGQTFTGAVRQVRINSTTVNNVVNYTAVAAVANPNGKLLPGMTATVKFLTGSASDALSVPNAALRFKPAIAAGDSTAARKRTRAAGTVQNVAAGAARDSTHTIRDSTMSTLWLLDSTNALKPVRVHAGLTDGSRTQVTGSAIKEGMQIVIGLNTGTGTTPAATSTNPLQPQSTSRRGGPPGPF
ncbi:MAG TPA: efflux RND transporter periplasmic adaptor subunit [Gemmatimonadaceae bacterium]|nr:efflux RND transporter periplasmic adaptor subunit [Gemmatimonadaceae bacterium]